MNDQQQLTKKEKEVCIDIWGCIPHDVDFVRNSNLFIEIVYPERIVPGQKVKRISEEDLVKMHGKWAKYYL